MSHDRFHGRVSSGAHLCAWPGCVEKGEFRAPGVRGASFDGPGDYRWFCLEHIRAFNAGYDYFEGMTPEQIWDAQSPVHGWDREARAFRPTAGVDGVPRWADFADPLDAISARARAAKARAEAGLRNAVWPDGTPVTGDERRALEVLDLAADAGRRALRQRYADLLHRYHPDRNGGDRSYEARLQAVVEAYQSLRKLRAFA